MPYSIQTKDGIKINNIPDNIDSNSDELKSRVADLRSKMGGQAPGVPSAPSSLPELPELMNSGLLSDQNKAKVAALSPALLTATNPNEISQIITSNFPDIAQTFDKDLESGRVFPILTNKKTGAQTQINKPGISTFDAMQGLGIGAALFPAGRGANATAKGLGMLAAKGAATQAGIEGVQAASGGEFNPEDVAITAASLPVGQVVGEKILAPMARAGAATAKEAFKSAFRGGEAGKKVLSDAIADFAEIGATPTVGQGTGDSLRQGFENVTSRLVGGGKIKKAVESTSNAMQARLQKIAGDLSKTSGTTDAGRVIKTGITGEGGFLERFAAKQGELWKAADDKIGDTAKSELTNTKRALDALVRSDTLGKSLNNPVLARVKSVIDQTLGKTRINQASQTRETVTEIPYGDLRSLRTQVGQMLSSKDLISDVPKSQLKRLYAGLSEDVRVVANKNGALPEFLRANKFTRTGIARIEKFIEPTIGKRELSDVYKALSRGGEGVETLRAMKKSLKPSEWEAVTANVIRSLGKSNPSQQGVDAAEFSVNKFLTDWTKLGPAKKELFSGSKKLNEYSKNLETIARVSERFKSAAKEMQNPSGTGQFVANVGVGTGAGTALLSGNLPGFGIIMGLVAANKGSAHLMTNPAFVKWLTTVSKGNLGARIPALNGIAISQGLESEVAELLDGLKTGGDNAKDSGQTDKPSGQ